MIKIRKYQSTDKEAVTVLSEQMLRFLRNYYCPTKAGLNHKSAIAPDLTRVVAILNQKIVGTTQYYPKNGMLRIISLSVHEEYKRQGIARALINHVCSVAKMRNCSAIRAATIEETGNVIIFKHLGFKVIGKNIDKLCEGINRKKVTDIELEIKLS